jgi:hypothetical protein
MVEISLLRLKDFDMSFLSGEDSRIILAKLVSYEIV